MANSDIPTKVGIGVETDKLCKDTTPDKQEVKPDVGKNEAILKRKKMDEDVADWKKKNAARDLFLCQRRLLDAMTGEKTDYSMFPPIPAIVNIERSETSDTTISPIKTEVKFEREYKILTQILDEIDSELTSLSSDETKKSIIEWGFRTKIDPTKY